MFHHIVSVSSVCLLLAFAGWDAEDTHHYYQEGIFEPSAFEDYYSSKYDSAFDNSWMWVFDLLSRDPDPCRRCSSFRCLSGLTRTRSDLNDLGLISWLFYKMLFTIEDLGAVVDGLALGNAVWLLFSTGVHISLYSLHSKGWKGFTFSKGETKETGCQKDSNVVRIIKLLKLKHRAEIEEMARTIEYLQSEGRQQIKHIKQKEVAVDTLQNAIRHLYHAHAEGDVEIVPEFHPDPDIIDGDLDWET